MSRESRRRLLWLQFVVEKLMGKGLDALMRELLFDQLSSLADLSLH